ncbi:MAG: glycosyltransferase [Thermomicrobiales bacterium]
MILVIGFVGCIVRDKEFTNWPPPGPFAGTLSAGETGVGWSGRTTGSGRANHPAFVPKRSTGRHDFGPVDETNQYYSLFDLVVLPSYQEGFCGNVSLFLAMEVPVVATRIPGCIDAVEDGVTGTLAPVHDAGCIGDGNSPLSR